MLIKTKEDYDKIIESIKNNVEVYEKYLSRLQYKISASNNETINIEYDKETKYRTNKYKYRKSN